MAREVVVRPMEIWLYRMAIDVDLSWLVDARWSAVTRGTRGITVACDVMAVPPPGVEPLAASGPYRVLRVGDLDDLSAPGTVASVAGPLAESGISIFTISSWDACDTLVSVDRLDEAVDALQMAGFQVAFG